MRLTRETLLRIARETVQKRSLAEPGLVAAYLTGSLLTEDPFLGNATDIDLVFVHAAEPAVRRELLPLTAEVHLDLRHNPRGEYDKPKQLRVHPWLGPELYDPLPLYVSQHFFEFVQAGVRDKFHEPANVLARANRDLENARQIWSGLQATQGSGPERLRDYLRSASRAANAVALLSGSPLSERRFLLQFPGRAEAAGRPELAAGLLGLLGAAQADAGLLAGLLPDWEQGFVAAAGRPGADVRLDPSRLGYYKPALQVLLTGDLPQTALWPLLWTWTLAAAALPPAAQAGWRSACERLGLGREGFPERLQALDAFLDGVEELLESYAATNSL